MAHVGKSYKVWFRRDWSNVSTNRQAFPEAYNTDIVGFRGPWFGNTDTNDVILRNLRKDDAAPRRWVSDLIRPGSIELWVRVEIINDFSDFTADREWKMFKKDGTLIFRALYHVHPPNSTYSLVDGTWAQGDPVYKDPMIQTTGFFGFNARAATWAQYNP